MTREDTLPSRNWRLTRRRFLLTTAGLALGGCGLGGAPATRAAKSSKSPDRPPNIVVYLADTCRADTLGAYGVQAPISPTVDRLAREGYLYERCYATATWTKPSMASMFSGVVPRVHQASYVKTGGPIEEQRVHTLRAGFPTVFESLKAAGYRTAYFGTNANIQQGHGLLRGVDDYRYVLAQKPAPQMDEVVAWLDGLGDEPFLLFIHQLDPHGPYQPSAAAFQTLHDASIDDAVAALPKSARGTVTRLQEALDREGYIPPPLEDELRSLPEEGMAFLQALYQAEVLDVDAQVARLLDALEQRDMGDDTAFVFTSDHGEQFRERGDLGHGYTLYDEELRVPLVIRPAGGAPSPHRVREPVSLLDVHATLITLGQGTMSAHAEGIPLLRDAATPAAVPARDLWADLDRNRRDVADWKACLVHDPYKVMSVDGGGYRVYDRSRDPHERHDLLEGTEEQRGIAEKLIAAFESRRARYARVAAGFGPPEYIQPDAELHEQLEAIGYG